MSGQIIGAKGLDDRHPLTAAEMSELFMAADGMAKQDLPPDLPAMMLSDQLIRTAATLKRYHDLASELVRAKPGENAALSPEQGQLLDLATKAERLVNIGPPIGVPKSRLIV